MPNAGVFAPDAPKAVGPYSHAVKATAGGPLIFISGQAGLVPETGKLIQGGVSAEAKQTMDNIGAVLKASGLDFKDIVKTTVGSLGLVCSPSDLMCMYVHVEIFTPVS